MALERDNLREALVASAAIPMVIEAVPDIPRAPAGIYWDGGLIDYHLHLPYSRSEGLVLYPHFTDRIVPGWLDKALPWRRARGPWLDNVVLVSPSREYLAKLPFGKLPDRSDFRRFASDFEGRMAYWSRAIAESARLGDEFLAFARATRIPPACCPCEALAALRRPIRRSTRHHRHARRPERPPARGRDARAPGTRRTGARAPRPAA